MAMAVSTVQSEFNPLLWKELSEDLLKSVISKLPFSRAVTFRTVSKLWKTDVVPRAARVEAPALVYFGVSPTGSSQWMQVSKSTNGKTSSLQDFQPTSSFPIPERQEKVVLTNSEGGLLFFAFFQRSTRMIRDIVACNPLTAQFRILGLPRPLAGNHNLNCQCDGLIGVVMDAKRENYLLVIAGLDEADNDATFLYKSSSSTWEKGPSLLPTLRELGVDKSDFCSCRSVCHEGNLYWDIHVYDVESEDYLTPYVLKFDVHQETWSILDVGCPNPFGCWWQQLESELPRPKPDGFPKDVNYNPAGIWVFAPSLTAVP